MLHKTELNPEKVKQIEGLVVSLINAIDQKYFYALRMRDSILELARYMDENEICEQNLICRRIKGMLKEKIREGKITSRWIEESLPHEYKRRYISSSKNRYGTQGCEIPVEELTMSASLQRTVRLLEMPNIEVELSIPRDKYQYLRYSMEHSKDQIFLVVENKIFKYAYADTVQL